MLDGRLGGAQCRAGGLKEEKNLFPLLGFEPTTVQRVAYLLYLLSYPGLFNVIKTLLICLFVLTFYVLFAAFDDLLVRLRGQAAPRYG